MEKRINRKIIVCLLTIALLFIAPLVEAQQSTKAPRTIGFPQGGATPASLVDAFRQGLRELGYVEGQNILIHYRRAEGKLDQIPALVAELVRLKVDVIFTANTAAALAAKKATTSIPIVIVAASDPVEAGLVDSLAWPGGNVTGLTRFTTELSGKRLELLKETFPRISLVAVLWNPEARGPSLAFKETRAAAQALCVQLQSLEVREPNDFDKAFSAITKKRTGALMVLGDAVTILQRARILEFAAKSRLPAMYDRPDDITGGGLMFYGVNESELFRRAAAYVDKILKGVKPADLPVEQPKKFELVINLKAAKQIGLTIPPNVLARADKVIR
jgi:putative ABC transport system substrate-binding protein